jgi:hypothetical protein
MLAAAAAWFGGRFDGACLILALLVFAMTFPGSLVRGRAWTNASPSRAIAMDIITGWIPIVALLALLGWASRTLGAFDPRVLLAWAIATPAALFAAHRLLPVIVPRVLAAEGLRKTAVIAGSPRACAPTRCSACASPATSTTAAPAGCRTSPPRRTSARSSASPTTRAATAST